MNLLMEKNNKRLIYIKNSKKYLSMHVDMYFNIMLLLIKRMCHILLREMHSIRIPHMKKFLKDNKT